MNGPSIAQHEFRVIRDYIEKHCGIRVTEEKKYLVETRLTTLMAECGCGNFIDLHTRAVADPTNALRDRIVDAMTTNETQWFRDKAPFLLLRNVILPEMAARIREKKKRRVRIWSAACSTGQEPYSIAMTVLDFCAMERNLSPEAVEVIATDISPTVLFLASSGRYDDRAIERGLDRNTLSRYFVRAGTVWTINDRVKRMVQLKRHNLQDSYSLIGNVDIVFCRNVLIYFSDTFKRDILGRIAGILNPDGYLIAGGSEPLASYSDRYELVSCDEGLCYRLASAGTRPRVGSPASSRTGGQR